MRRAHLRRTVVAAALVAAASGVAAVPATAGTTAGAPYRLSAAASPGEWWRSAMGVDELNRRGTGKGVTVAVIDGPIDADVPELRGKVVSSRSFCTGARFGSPLRSPSATGKPAEHATSMAALIAGSGEGTGPGGRGIRGIAPDATIRHYAAMYRNDEDKATCPLVDGADDVDEGIARAIDRAASDGADVISISLIAGYDPELIDSVLNAYRADAIVVAGTPNDRSGVQYPGLANGVLAVVGVDSAGQIPEFGARRSNAIALAAPAKEVMAGSYDGTGWHSDTIVSGSSIATAIVAGGIAAMRSAHPGASAGQILHAVKDNVGLREKKSGSGYETWFRRSGSDLPTVRTANPAFGWGIFDPADAVQVDPSALPKDNPFVRQGKNEEPTAQQVATFMSLPAPTPTGSASPSASPTAGVTQSGTPAPQAAPAVRDDGGSGPPWLLLGAVGLVLLLLAGGGLVLRGRRAAAGTSPVPTTSVTTTSTTTTDGAAGAEGRNH
ncbi:S8/S53 family peptidase [Arthrobacter sp. NEB 688]|uniref:S8 family peptidase n=1 Tax=Arthrobacter sp. NEB 688 TaxID=904039 RepID=UPI001563059C|nr:S8/S53 family peptidase [Arthrobacter sp. NEB 688]QKE85340.1 S8 family serine peptidase [Arthrobacter sp. NEB 688]